VSGVGHVALHVSGDACKVNVISIELEYSDIFLNSTPPTEGVFHSNQSEIDINLRSQM
jgi:hypothetical protein